MAASRLCAAGSLLLCLINFSLVFSGPVIIPVQSVSETLIRSALNTLNVDSPTHHVYKGGNLISAQKLVEPLYVIYRLTFDLNPVCKDTPEGCPREACTIEVKQHEGGSINVLKESIQCMYLYPQSAQDDLTQAQEPTIEQDVIDNVEKQMITNQSVELDHEIQETGDQSERPFIAMKASSSSYCPGCPYELNPNLPGLVAFGEQVAKSMDEQIQNDFKHKVVGIVNVTRAVPPSSNVVQYKILLRVGESDCLKNAIIDQSECSVQYNRPIKTCSVTFEEQPWQQSSRKITKNNCTINEEVVNKVLVTEESASEKLTEALESLKNILENFTYATPTKEDQGQQEVTEYSVKKVLPKKVEEEEKPAERFINKAKEFEEFLEDFNIPTKDVQPSEKTDGNKEEVKEIVAKKISKTDKSEESHRNKRDLEKKRKVGAPSTKDVNDPDIQKFAQIGFNKYSENFEGTNEPFMVEIVEATVQVVSGLLYRIKVKLGSSDCPKGVKENCKLLSESPINECLFKIWSQPWIDNGSPKVTVECDSNGLSRRKRELQQVGLVGGPVRKDVNDEEIKRMTQVGFNKYSENFEGTNEPFMVEIVEATVQVVSGLLYKIKVKLGSSDCPKGVKENCKLLSESPINECTFKIWSQPWIDNGSPKVTVECDSNGLSRRKRELQQVGLVGGPVRKDVNDEEIKRMTQVGFNKYSENFEGTNEPFMVEIVEATVQVVSGLLYKVKVKLGSSDCPKGVKENCKLLSESPINDCLFKIWSQPWIDNGSPEVTIECNSNSLSRRKRESHESTKPGGPHHKDVNDEQVQKFVKIGLNKFAENSEGTNEPMLVEVIHASVQVVSGLLYKIKVKLGTSNCPKGVKENCQLKSDSEIKNCLFTVWSQPWKEQGDLDIKINCDLDARKKRSLRGAGYSQKMLQLAESMKKENEKHTELFEDFIRKFAKRYASVEERMSRFEIFKANLQVIEELQTYERGTAEYGVTRFADLTREEFKKQHLGLRPELSTRLENDIPMKEAKIPNITLPPKFDWRDHKVVTPVKDQGQCGSCWAFSVTGNVEGQYAIKHGKLISLSEQELVDCDTLDEGCNGGLPENAYKAIENLGGLELESDYPYDAENEKCHFNQKKAMVQLSSYVNITSNETKIAQWLVKHGPIAVGINANAMQFYYGGVSHPFKFLCNPENLDHGVLIVGYGTSKYPLFHKELPYWIIKNSWGPSWGEQGYYRVYRGDGTCGVNSMATSALVV